MTSAQVALSGFRLDYQNPEGDRSLNVIQVIVGLGDVSSREVNFTVFCQLADKNFDDEYNGQVRVLVIADVA